MPEFWNYNANAFVNWIDLVKERRISQENAASFIKCIFSNMHIPKSKSPKCVQETIKSLF